MTPEPTAERQAQTIRGALWNAQGLGGHNNYRAAEDALAGLLAEIELARLLLTPGARLSKDDGLQDKWVKGRIRWHRLDGNDELADEMLRKENSIRTAIGKEPLDV